MWVMLVVIVVMVMFGLRSGGRGMDFGFVCRGFWAV